MVAGNEQNVRIVRHVAGGYELRYQCPYCCQRLVSRTEKAGTSNTCPNCRAEFRVPGEFAVGQMNCQNRDEWNQDQLAGLNERGLGLDRLATKADAQRVQVAAKLAVVRDFIQSSQFNSGLSLANKLIGLLLAALVGVTGIVATGFVVVYAISAAWAFPLPTLLIAIIIVGILILCKRLAMIRRN